MLSDALENPVILYGLGGLIVLGLIVWIYNSSPIQSAVAAGEQVGSAISSVVTQAGQQTTQAINNATTQGTITNAFVTAALGPLGALGQVMVSANKLDDYFQTGQIPTFGGG